MFLHQKITSKGFVNKFNLLLKNVTTESDNSKEYSIILGHKILAFFV